MQTLTFKHYPLAHPPYSPKSYTIYSASFLLILNPYIHTYTIVYNRIAVVWFTELRKLKTRNKKIEKKKTSSRRTLVHASSYTIYIYMTRKRFVRSLDFRLRDDVRPYTFSYVCISRNYILLKGIGVRIRVLQ